MENQDDIFRVVYSSTGISKNKIGKILIETSTKGLIYKTEVFLNNFLIDAKEVTCLDLATLENGEVIFKERYLATHKAFEMEYFLEKVFVKVLTTEGNYANGEGRCTVNSYIFENIIKNEVLVDDYEIDTLETEVEESVVQDKKAFKLKYTKLHNDFVKENIVVPKFPVNTILNPLLKKYPLYKKNPLYAFYLFLLSIFLALWILSLIFCGKALIKLVQKFGNKEASLVVRDLQKTICIKEKLKGEEAEKEKKKILSERLYKDGFLFLPEKLLFKEESMIQSLYIKNSSESDLIVKLNNKIIDGLDNPLIKPNMIITLLSRKKELILKPEEIKSFEFKIENTFLKNNFIDGGTYNGRLIFEVIQVKYNKTKIVPIEFTFTIKQPIKDNNES